MPKEWLHRTDRTEVGQRTNHGRKESPEGEHEGVKRSEGGKHSGPVCGARKLWYKGNRSTPLNLGGGLRNSVAPIHQVPTDRAPCFNPPDHTESWSRAIHT
ncbi:hypothetical protein ATANTOWER_013657 [Ataeniobius toweri]|uniref:Uncharacterized protein n=1 Tax=Ataeniobius toweri TaxID=208326 RepID=A0ABU7AXS1_9TELE|nr:hypothetical protein [Ataeniobius toweri]